MIRPLMRLAVFSLFAFRVVSSTNAQETNDQTGNGQIGNGQIGNGLTTNIGVIDMNDVLQKSNAIDKVREVLDQRNLEFQASITEEELRLRTEERVLNTEKDQLAEDDFNNRFAKFERDVVALQRSIQQQQNLFDRSMQQVNSTLEQELIKIVEEIAKDRQLTMVIQRKNVVIYDSTTDITDEALRRLNERTKNLTVTLQREDQ